MLGAPGVGPPPPAPGERRGWAVRLSPAACDPTGIVVGKPAAGTAGDGSHLPCCTLLHPSGLSCHITGKPVLKGVQCLG